MSQSHYDVVIAGGGPGGSTTGGFLKKYDPSLRVLIAERERFPREHIGESQLPPIGAVLNELGVWDKLEAANFPIKLGATFRWGTSPELWDFNLIPPEIFTNDPRPAKYTGIRRDTAWQVDRAVYDHILLDHAAALGCEVRQETGATGVTCQDDTISAVKLSDGTTVTADRFVDASGNAAVLRRALGVEVDCPTFLKNIAIYDYWEDAEWADTVGSGGTRVQVMSVGFGWLWFIPISKTRTSLGLVCPVTYYKESGKTPAELYDEALGRCDRIGALIRKATRENKIRTTNDWSYVAQRTVGANWYLVGETAGFADPILSAGLTLTHCGGRECAYTILAERKGDQDVAWLKHHYHENQVRRVRQHMRFAEFWYAANGQFNELQKHCQDIAREAGLSLNAKEAWQWFAQGGFSNDVIGQAGIGGLTLSGVAGVTQYLTSEPVSWAANDNNVFRLNLEGATSEVIPVYEQGQIRPVTCYVRAGYRLPLVGFFELLFEMLKRTDDIAVIVQSAVATAKKQGIAADTPLVLRNVVQALEVLVTEGWATARLDPMRPRLRVSTPKEGGLIRDHVEYKQAP